MFKLTHKTSNKGPFGHQKKYTKRPIIGQSWRTFQNFYLTHSILL